MIRFEYTEVETLLCLRPWFSLLILQYTRQRIYINVTLPRYT
jgi:hypothetical protein